MGFLGTCFKDHPGAPSWSSMETFHGARPWMAEFWTVGCWIKASDAKILYSAVSAARREALKNRLLDFILHYHISFTLRISGPLSISNAFNEWKTLSNLKWQLKSWVPESDSTRAQQALRQRVPRGDEWAICGKRPLILTFFLPVPSPVLLSSH